jgi:integrase
MTWKFSDHVRCYCKGPDGNLLGLDCPQLWRKDGSWNTRHGAAGFAGRLPTSSGVKQFKRFGYSSRKLAQDAVRHVGKLLELARTEADRALIGDMVWSVKRGARLPTVEDVQRRLGLGQDPAQEGMTVAAWLDTWLAGKRRTKRESTCRGYEMHIRTWLKPQVGHLPSERLNAGHIEELFTTIRRFNTDLAAQRAAGVAPMSVKINGDVRGQSRECGETTQYRIFATLRAAVNAAVKARKISWNPCDGVQDIAAPVTVERQRWTPAQAAQFIAATADDPMGLMLRVGVLRGCRRGEPCGFRWADADLDKPYPDPVTGEKRKGAVLVVRRPIVELGGKLIESKTNAGERKVFLDHDTAALLREHRKAQLKQRMKAGDAWQENDLVFCTDDGSPWHPDHVSKRFKVLAADAGVPVITLHEGGRHTGNSLMQDAGVDQELRMREVGHAGKAVNDRYTHPLEQAHLAASEQTAALVRKAGKAKPKRKPGKAS